MKNYIFDNLKNHTRKHIALIFVWGTISMIRDAKTGTLIPAQTLHDLFAYEPELQTIADIDLIHLCNKDSSDIAADIWLELGQCIINHYDQYDGFVIAHGTDTMAYTASALSFLLDHLSKPVIITGSQYPLSGGMRTDARINLFNAILFAQMPISEVAICFANQLLRWNRSIKINAEALDAFASPNFALLWSIGSQIKISHECIYRSNHDWCRIVWWYNGCVALIKIYPWMHTSQFADMLHNTQGVVLEGFGSGGNIPQILLPLLQDYINHGGMVALKSQCYIGTIDLSIYEWGHQAQQMWVFNCLDMTSEAALCKLDRLLSQYSNRHQIQQLFESNIVWELTKTTDKIVWMW